MNWVESLVLKSLGKVIIAIGFVGSIGTIFMDEMARGLPVAPRYFDWLQVSALCIFIGILIFGIWADRFLNITIRKIIEG